ncbi:hypothetical protein CEUSTIGMA_g13051.t1 [Chlamydomonas eustigma]|uniref:Transcription elongation factor spt6 n=1 Tax=Chlamydomonas eustigma TaxID=1157962 RepID=A0A250XRG4_9CHLO|nr:hypothetical protein CEUSTIGMA_g13051.t1 [Chlamydomonas eustigma]|eukprot:GAX85636.1 hypothetical protein CEUSTIGMA_g13051.t1 [Chlamydomonas eustigma]
MSEKLVEDEAALEDELEEEGAGEEEEEAEDSSEEEEDDEENEYEDDGFVVDENADEEEGAGEGSDGEEAVRKKRKKKRKEVSLDEEDFELLEEHQIKVNRPKEKKRLKRAGEGRQANDADEMRADLFGGDDLEDELADEGPQDDLEEADERGRSGRSSRRSGRDGREEGRRVDDADAFLDEDDEMGDFIVDEGDEGARRRRARRVAGAVGLNAQAYEEAADIFGNVDDLVKVWEGARASQAHEEAGDEDALQEEELAEVEEDDEEVADRRRIAREERRKQLIYQRALKVLDPETLAAQFLKPEDQAIKEKDFPERLQLEGIDPSESLDIATASEWIYDHIFGDLAYDRLVRNLVENGILEVDGNTPTPHPNGWFSEELYGLFSVHNKMRPVKLGSQRGIRKERHTSAKSTWRVDEEAQAAVRAAISQVLTQIWERGEEVPLIGMYRKELSGELLSMREEDVPGVTTEEELQSRPDAKRQRELYEPGMVQAKHRRIRRFEVLWAVYEYSLKFRKVARRRLALLSRLEGAIAMLPDSADADRETLRTLMLSVAERYWSHERLNDADAQLRLITDAHALTHQVQALGMSQLSLNDPSSGPKAPQRAPPTRSLYRLSRESGLSEVMQAVLLTPGQYNENLDEPETQPHEPSEPSLMPSEWMEQQLQMHSSLRDVLGVRSGDDLRRKIKSMAIQELVAEPQVREIMRSMYKYHATISTQPTAAGEGHPSLEPWAKYGPIKRLNNKPVRAFSGTDQFLRIQGAVKEGLITFSLGADVSKLEELVKLYLSSNVSVMAKAWNEFRQEVIRSAIADQLFPILEREMKQQMLSDAKEVAITEFSSSIWQLASRPPLRLTSENDDGEVVVDQPRVMAAVWGSGDKQPTVLVLLDERGALVDLLPCGQLSGNIPKSGKSAMDVFTDERKKKDVLRIKDKILDKPPHAILVGCGNPSTSQLSEDLHRICDHIVDEHARDIRERLETRVVEVRYADERLAALWESCRAAKEEFPEQPVHVRRAIALGRLAQDPLAVLAQLAGPGKEVLSIRATEVQDLLTPEEKMGAVEQVLVTALSQVGVDINLAANVSWRRDCLAYVPGLGPRKARSLLEAVQRNGNKVESRNEMYRELRVLGKNVFRNCGCFLRVSSAGLPQMANLEFRQLDASRVHPESYRLAVALCEKASGDEDVEAAIEECADKIERLDLVGLAAEKEVPGKLATLIDIRQELLMPGAEIRGNCDPLKDREVFLLQHGESEDTLKEGRLVEAKITWVGRDEIKCRLAHTPIEAVIHRDNLSSKITSFSDLRNHFQRDQAVTGRIMVLKAEESQRDGSKHHILELNTRGDYLADVDFWETKYCKRDDPYFKLSSEAAVLARSGGGGGGPSSTPSRSSAAASSGVTRREADVVPRPIRHPLFQNISMKKAQELLNSEDKQVGECIIRPAQGAKGSIMLALSIKIYAGKNVGPVVHSMDVVEAGKKPGPAAHMQLVTPLQIDLKMSGIKEALSFEDLDELHQAFVIPLVEQVQFVTRHRKFRDEVKSRVDEMVIAEKNQDRSKTPYAIGIEAAKPGVFFISFVMSNSAHHEHFVVTPKGPYFRQKLFKDVERLLDTFKKDPMNRTSRQQVHGISGYIPSQGYPSATGGTQYMPMMSVGAYPSQTYGNYGNYPDPAGAVGGYGSYGVQAQAAGGGNGTSYSSQPGSYNNGHSNGRGGLPGPPAVGRPGGSQWPPSDQQQYNYGGQYGPGGGGHRGVPPPQYSGQQQMYSGSQQIVYGR